MGSLVCHQQIARTIIIADNHLPLCARCTGIYTGFLSGVLCQFLLWRTKLKELPPPAVLFPVLFLLFCLVLDSISSYFGIYTLTNQARMLLGLLGGYAISLLLFPIFNFSLFPSRERDRLQPGSIVYLWILVSICLLCFLPAFSTQPVFLFFFFVSIGGLMLLYLMINMVAAARFTNCPNRTRHIIRTLKMGGICLALLILEVGILTQAHAKQ